MKFLPSLCSKRRRHEDGSSPLFAYQGAKKLASDASSWQEREKSNRKAVRVLGIISGKKTVPSLVHGSPPVSSASVPWMVLLVTLLGKLAVPTLSTRGNFTEEVCVFSLDRF